MDDEILALPRIRIDPDWGGAYAWTQYRQATPLAGFFGDATGLATLETDFRWWQERFESTSPWGEALEPKGGWKPFSEDGLLLCQDLATWVGADGYVLYYLPPARLGLGGKRLLLTWDPQGGNPRHAGINSGPESTPTASTWNGAPWMGR
jgi:hypothetical protein